MPNLIYRLDIPFTLDLETHESCVMTHFNESFDFTIRYEMQMNGGIGLTIPSSPMSEFKTGTTTNRHTVSEATLMTE